MPYTRAQLTAIMDKPGAAFVPKNVMPYAGRVCQTLMLKKVYAWEDKAALDEFKLLKAVYGDITAFATQQAVRYSLDTLAMDSTTLRWRRDVLDYTQHRLNTLAEQVARNAYEYASTAFLAGYYGRLWQLTEIAKTPLTIQPIPMTTVGNKVLHPALQEVAADMYTYATQGIEWRAKYQHIYTAAYTKMSSALTIAQAQGQGVNAALHQAIGLPLGMTSKPNAKTSAAYYQSQLETRTAILRSSNQGGIYALHTQNKRIQESTDGWIVGVQWITAGDSRVCPICLSHDGQVFIINDLVGIALMGLPPDGSHYGCRCSYAILLLLDMLKKDNNQPPEQTWNEWLVDNSVFGSLDVFMNDTQLKSSAL